MQESFATGAPDVLAEPECCAAEPRLKPRDRIVVSARDLFRRHGIRGIGVDAIAEAAGTNKMTLYRHFGSKDDLVVACLQGAACDAETIWRQLEDENPGDPRGQLNAWVRVADQHISGQRRGCDFANAAVELVANNPAAHEFIEKFKNAQRQRLAELCRQAGVANADLLADALALAFEGASVNSQIAGAEGPWSRFASVAQAVIAAFFREEGASAPSDSASALARPAQNRHVPG